MGPGQERGHQVPIQPWIHVVRFALLVVAARVPALGVAVARVLLTVLAVVAPALRLAIVAVVVVLSHALLVYSAGPESQASALPTPAVRSAVACAAPPSWSDHQSVRS